MAYVTREFDNVCEMVDYLNDIVLGKTLPANVRVRNLGSKTLIVNDGTADRTATFVDASGEGLLPKEIIDQIKAAHASLANVTLRSYCHNVLPSVHIAVVTPTYTVKKTGTANTILGFSTAVDVVVGANAVPKANIVSIVPMNNQRFSVIHE